LTSIQLNPFTTDPVNLVQALHFVILV